MMWKPVPGYEELYEVSDTGGVRKTDGVPMRGNLNSYGYRVVSLTKNHIKKDMKVHRLVAMAFLPTIPGKECVNHIDGDKTNNDVSNLEWCTKGENNRHARDVLCVKTESRPVWQLSTTGEPIALFVNMTAAAKQLGGEQMMIAACCKGTAQSAYDYIWEFADGEQVKKMVAEVKYSAVLKKIESLRAEADELERQLSGKI